MTTIKNTKSSEPSFFAWMHEQGELYAKQLHEAAYVYALYGALDGLSISYSMFKYLFDMRFSTSDLSSADVMHEWMLTPEGVLATASTSIILIAFSTFANLYDKDKKNNKTAAFKRYLLLAWPYLRDSTKGLKNAYKGFRSTIKAINSLGIQNLNQLIVPVGLLLGGLAVLNRIWSKSIREKPTDMIKKCGELLEEIQSQDGSKDHFELLREHFFGQAQELKQSPQIRFLGLLSAAYGGIVDGLYLYMGVFALTTIVPPLLFGMMAGFFAACILTRIYEEYAYQREIDMLQAEIDLRLRGKELEFLFEKQKSLEGSQLNNQSSSLNDDLQKKIDAQLKEFEEKQETLVELKKISYSSAVLAGMKDGLAAYGSLASMVFAASTILSVAIVPFPPALLLACAASGVVLILGFILHSAFQAYKHNKKLDEEHANFCTQAAQEKISESAIASSPQFFFQEWFEVIRSFFSGVGKGAKAVEYTMNPCQVQNEEGHYRDTPVMFAVMVFSSTIHAIVLALQALADELKPEKEKGAKVDTANAALPQYGPNNNPLPSPTSASNAIANASAPAGQLIVPAEDPPMNSADDSMGVADIDSAPPPSSSPICSKEKQLSSSIHRPRSGSYSCSTRASNACDDLGEATANAVPQGKEAQCGRLNVAPLGIPGSYSAPNSPRKLDSDSESGSDSDSDSEYEPRVTRRRSMSDPCRSVAHSFFSNRAMHSRTPENRHEDECKREAR